MRATFALLCFNQERFVGEAIAAALAQTVPLDIFISDDCSTDETWAIINEGVRGYSGPHSIRLNRNSANLGVGAHTDQAIRNAHGEIVIIAAGDDVSLPHRAARVLDAFMDAATTCVASHILCDGAIISPLPPGIPSADAAINSGAAVFGAALAFRRSAMLLFPPVSGDVRYGEDVLLPFRAGMVGRVIIVPDALVEYRQHAASLMGESHPTSSFAVYSAALQRSLASMAQVRRDQIDSAYIAHRRGLIDLPRFVSLSTVLIAAMGREEPLRKLLFRERHAFLSWLKAIVQLRLSPKDAAKTLFMGAAPRLWHRYLTRRFRALP